jgi:hypothetical protein
MTQASSASDRTFLGLTRTQIVDRSANIDDPLKRTIGSQTAYPEQTSSDIWADMPEKSYYYMLFDASTVHAR